MDSSPRGLKNALNEVLLEATLEELDVLSSLNDARTYFILSHYETKFVDGTYVLVENVGYNSFLPQFSAWLEGLHSEKPKTGFEKEKGEGIYLNFYLEGKETRIKKLTTILMDNPEDLWKAYCADMGYRIVSNGPGKDAVLCAPGGEEVLSLEHLVASWHYRGWMDGAAGCQPPATFPTGTALGQYSDGYKQGLELKEWNEERV